MQQHDLRPVGLFFFFLFLFFFFFIDISSFKPANLQLQYTISPQAVFIEAASFSPGP